MTYILIIPKSHHALMISSVSVEVPVVEAISASNSFKRLESVRMCEVEGTRNWKAVVYDESVSYF